MIKLRQHWSNIRSSFWFLPGLIVIGLIILALIMIQADPLLGTKTLQHWPSLFRRSTNGAREILSVIASSMIGVTGVVFSITLVALTLTASQYTPRVLRNFMSDRFNQTVLGVFVGVFVYCLVVMQSIPQGDKAEFIPSIAVLIGMLLGLVCIGLLVFFIHHMATSIQAAQILAGVYQEARQAMDRLFPDTLPEEADQDHGSSSTTIWQPVLAHQTGYIQQVDVQHLIRFAQKRDTVIRLERGIGSFLIEGMPLLSVAGEVTLDDDDQDRLRRLCMVDYQRSVDQDVAFAIRQLVDIALKGLSPGINDTTTAVMSIDYLTAVLAYLGERCLDRHYRDEAGKLRVQNCGPDYDELVDKAFAQIRENAEGTTAVLVHLLESLQILTTRTRTAPRRRTLLAQVRYLAEAAQRSVPAPIDRERLATLARQVEEELLATLPDS